MSLGLRLRCDNGHSQVIRTEGMPREWVEEWGRLMDGTSDLYTVPIQPDEVTWIGHCQTCPARIHSDVVEVKSGDQLAIMEGDMTTILGTDTGGLEDED